MTKEKPLHEAVADKLLAQLEAGTSFLQKLNGQPQQRPFQIPFNPSTGKSYRGMNALALAMQSYEDPRWVTLKQANSMGAQVPKGAKATPINFLKENEGQMVPQTAWVFNAEQMKNMPSLAESLEKLVHQKSAVADPAKQVTKPVSQVLSKGDEIAYNGTTYRVNEDQKRGKQQIEDLGTGEKIKISAKDGLHGSLLEAKSNPQQLAQDISQSESVGQSGAMEQDQNTGSRIKR
ncbi:MAG TPA: ArdC family protein [Pedobacter sp.]|uniref:ArdC family protein n=1 Tax=Pedobacter sp. TaxID=1411316 RepID=UPI002B789608|nr:ArdC family protein [Pedobacter sp.]HMI02730.1 ArdC family protein [Pedobacter sp.]